MIWILSSGVSNVAVRTHFDKQIALSDINLNEIFQLDQI